MSRNTIKLDSRPLEERLKDPYFKTYYERVQDTYNKVKPYLLSDEEIRQYFNIAKLTAVMEKDKDKVGDLNYFKYITGEYILSKEENKYLVDLLNKDLDNELDNEKLNIILFNYFFMQFTEAMDLLKSICKCFYLIDKYKGTPLAEDLIKWLNSVNHYESYKPIIFEDKDIQKIEDKEEKEEALKKCLNYYEIYFDYVHITDTLRGLLNDMEYNDNTITKRIQENFFDYFGLLNVSYYLLAKEKDNDGRLEAQDYIEPIKNMFSNRLRESKGLYEAREDLEEVLEQAQEKYGIKVVLSDEEIKIIDDKLTYAKNILNKYTYKEIDYISNFNTLTYLLAFNEDTKKILKDTNTNLSIQDLEEGNIQQEPITSSDEEVSEDTILDNYTKLSKEELKDKYKDSILLKDKDLDYNRKWAKLDTSKVNSNVMDLRESLIKKVENNTNITNKELKNLKSKTRKTKEDYDKIKELEARIKEQNNNRDNIVSEINDLKADKSLIEQQLKDISDARQVKKLVKQVKELDKTIKEKESILNNSGVSFQLNTEGKMIYEKTNKRTKESYKLMLNSDYDIQNFNSEGRNFLFYIPNIPNINNELEEDFITLDIEDYLDFTGRPNGNISRIRKNLFNTLKEMRKETYDINYIDDKGVRHEDSLVLLADIKSTEYKGKASVKVQLGATFKDNLKEAFNKNQIQKVDKDIFKLGQGKNNKAELMAKEIFIYLSRLARIEAKQGTINGQYVKDLHLDTIISHLVELNLINYDLVKYNEKVKEPLLYALNTGKDLGLFDFKTNAFKYYDDIIGKGNNGANVKDKIENFESGKDYGIRIILHIDKIDLDTNNKAHKTYTDYKRKNTRKKKATNK